MYCIFTVSDYKGGELHSNINLTKDRLMANLAEYFEGYNGDVKNLLMLQAFIAKRINDRDFISTYAGGDGFCGKIYKIENDRLVSVNWSTLVEPIAEYISKKWR